MKILKVIEFGDPILREKTKHISLEFLNTTEFKDLVKQMIITMRKNKGVGLAAPQIGKSLRISVMETRPTPTRPNLKKKGPMIVVNPRIIKKSKKQVLGWEGCLSCAGLMAKVERSENITVEYFNKSGEKSVDRLDGLWARIFQHELDHLDGVLYVDRVQDTKTFVTRNEFRKRFLKG